jgi:hypothetical protein
MYSATAAFWELVAPEGAQFASAASTKGSEENRYKMLSDLVEGNLRRPRLSSFDPRETLREIYEEKGVWNMLMRRRRVKVALNALRRLDAVASGALQTDPMARYDSTQDLVDDAMMALAGHSPVHVRDKASDYTFLFKKYVDRVFERDKGFERWQKLKLAAYATAIAAVPVGGAACWKYWDQVSGFAQNLIQQYLK